VNVDVATATQRGIPVLYTPGRNTVAVADFTIALLLAIVREIPQADAHLRANTWHINGDLPYFYFRGPELEGKTLGLVGCGAIGRLVAQRARGFGMDVVIFDPYLSPDRIGDVGRLVVLDTLLLRADVVSIHCPLNAETSGLINQAAIAKMKPTAYLINTARAAVVDEDGLYCALSEQRLAGAALDVFWQEPLAPDSRWRNLRNVVLTPHIAGASRDVVCRHSQMIVADLKRLAGGECPAHIANPDILSVGRN
jgi:phosphoglycerate dehydrogenase-like enzyme